MCKTKIVWKPEQSWSILCGKIEIDIVKFISYVIVLSESADINIKWNVDNEKNLVIIVILNESCTI